MNGGAQMQDAEIGLTCTLMNPSISYGASPNTTEQNQEAWSRVGPAAQTCDLATLMLYKGFSHSVLFKLWY